MEQKSWICTLIIQFALCVAFYCSINIGRPQTPSYRFGKERQTNEIHFISVRGGFRPLEEQIRLLKQIEKVVNRYKVGFVINISELGEDDPLLENATHYIRSSRATWHTTIAPRVEEPDYFFKRVNISSGRSLDMLSLNTRSIQDFSSGTGNVKLKQFSRELESNNSNWRIAAGFHPLSCNRSLEQTQAKENDDMHNMLLKLRVDAYLSGESCANEAAKGGPYLTFVSQRSYRPKKTKNMFLLHRVSPLEIATYGVSFKGNIVHESTIKQRGRDVM